MAGVAIARPQDRKYVPAFTVRKLEGKREHVMLTFDKSGKKVTRIVEEDAGYEVTFSKGHSIRVRNDEELHRLGFDDTIPLLDGESDEPVAYRQNPIAMKKDG